MYISVCVFWLYKSINKYIYVCVYVFVSIYVYHHVLDSVSDFDSYIYAPQPEVEHSGERINGCHSHKAKLFYWIEHFGIR